MLKYVVYLCHLLTLWSTCAAHAAVEDTGSLPEFQGQNPKVVNLDINENSIDCLKGWVGYYRSMDPAFSLDRFVLEKTDSTMPKQSEYTTIRFTKNGIIN